MPAILFFQSCVSSVLSVEDLCFNYVMCHNHLISLYVERNQSHNTRYYITYALFKFEWKKLNSLYINVCFVLKNVIKIDKLRWMWMTWPWNICVSTSTVTFTMQERSRKGRQRSVNPVACCISCSGILEWDGRSGYPFRGLPIFLSLSGGGDSSKLGRLEECY